MNRLHDINETNPCHQIPHLREPIDFSPAEYYLITYYQRRFSQLNTWTWYLAYVLPMTLFAIYGVYKQDFLAVSVAFGAFLLLSLYGTHSGIKRDQRLKTILTKYHDRMSQLQSDLNHTNENIVNKENNA